jgi:hypothetical protein
MRDCPSRSRALCVSSFFVSASLVLSRAACRVRPLPPSNKRSKRVALLRLRQLGRGRLWASRMMTSHTLATHNSTGWRGRDVCRPAPGSCSGPSRSQEGYGEARHGQEGRRGAWRGPGPRWGAGRAQSPRRGGNPGLAAGRGHGRGSGAPDCEGAPRGRARAHLERRRSANRCPVGLGGGLSSGLHPLCPPRPSARRRNPNRRGRRRRRRMESAGIARSH